MHVVTDGTLIWHSFVGAWHCFDGGTAPEMALIERACTDHFVVSGHRPSRVNSRRYGSQPYTVAWRRPAKAGVVATVESVNATAVRYGRCGSGRVIGSARTRLWFSLRASRNWNLRSPEDTVNPAYGKAQFSLFTYRATPLGFSIGSRALAPKTRALARQSVRSDGVSRVSDTTFHRPFSCCTKSSSRP